MAYLPSAHSAHDFPSHDSTHARRERKPGLLWRFMQAIATSRMQQADREIARYLAATGGKFTDESEREIERRLIAGPRW